MAAMVNLSASVDAIATAVIDAGMPLPQACEVIEARIIDAALMRTGHNVTAASRLLGVNRNTIHNKLSTRPLETRKALRNAARNSKRSAGSRRRNR